MIYKRYFWYGNDGGERRSRKTVQLKPRSKIYDGMEFFLQKLSYPRSSFRRSSIFARLWCSQRRHEKKSKSFLEFRKKKNDRKMTWAALAFSPYYSKQKSLKFSYWLKRETTFWHIGHWISYIRRRADVSCFLLAVLNSLSIMMSNDLMYGMVSVVSRNSVSFNARSKGQFTLAKT